MDKHNFLIAILDTTINDRFIKIFQSENKDLWVTDIFYFQDKYLDNDTPKTFITKDGATKSAIINPKLQDKYITQLAKYKFNFIIKLADIVEKEL